MALDAASATGALVSWSAGGPSVGGLARASLVAGALAPSPAEPNVPRKDEVEEALASVRRSLGVNGRAATLILPEGVARIALLEVPAGLPAREYARFRLAQALPYPAAEAIVDALPLAGRRFLCGAVRRGVVEAYEDAARGAGFHVDQVTLASMAAVTGLRTRVGPGGAGGAVILGDVAMSLAVFRGGGLALFRSRRRDPGDDEGAWIRREIVRTSALAGAGEGEIRVAVAGSGAGALLRQLAQLGCPAEPAWPRAGRSLPVESAELSWLGAALT